MVGVVGIVALRVGHPFLLLLLIVIKFCYAKPSISIHFNMVGVVGIEPTHGGVKVPCLTTWLHPKNKRASKLYEMHKKVKIILQFFDFSISYIRNIYLFYSNIDMNFLKLIMSRPSDQKIRYFKIALGAILILLGILAFQVQGLTLQDRFFGMTLNSEVKQILSYAIMALGVFPLVLGGLDINILSRGYTRILQIVFGILLILIGMLFTETAVLTVDIFYFLIGFVVAFIGITGKFITKK